MQDSKRSKRLIIGSFLAIYAVIAGSSNLWAEEEVSPRLQVYSAPTGVHLTPLNYLQQEIDRWAPEPSEDSEFIPSMLMDTGKMRYSSIRQTAATKAQPKMDMSVPAKPALKPAETKPATNPEAKPTTQTVATPPAATQSTANPKPAPAEKASSPEPQPKPAATIPETQPEKPTQALQNLQPSDTSVSQTPTEPRKPRQAIRIEMPSIIGNMVYALSTQKPALPITYTPLEAIVVFPVIKQGREKAFGDLSVLFARELALKLEATAPQTRVYNPVYTVDELRVRGLSHIYDQIMGYYLKAGRPEPAATDYLLKQLASSDGKTISRVIFVEADLDMAHIEEQSNWLERINGLLTDSTPKQMKVFINSRLQIFDADNPSLPMVWAGNWRRSMKANQYTNITPSVFQDSDSQQSFSQLSREMSRELLWMAPKSTYMAPQYDLSVQGKLASQNSEKPDAKQPVTEAHKQAIQRILQRESTAKP